MSGPRFTPGPLGWVGIQANASGGSHIYLIDANDRKIAALWGQAEEKRANAELWSTAPDMYRLLGAAKDALRSYQYGNSAPDLAQDIADQIEALLARVREVAG